MTPNKIDSASVPRNGHFTPLFANVDSRMPSAVVLFLAPAAGTRRL